MNEADLEEAYFGTCMLCYQGQLVAMKVRHTDTLILICDECGIQWKKPSDANRPNAEACDFQDLERVDKAEVEAHGWSSKTSLRGTDDS